VNILCGLNNNNNNNTSNNNVPFKGVNRVERGADQTNPFSVGVKYR
jgi:hypothetical protein